MGIRLIFLNLLVVTNADGCPYLNRNYGLLNAFQEIAPAFKTVPQTDTGGQVEHTKALERMVLKELGKMFP
jgi:hypothetical protein